MPRTRHYHSKALSRSQVAGAIAAHHYAEAIGCPLNLALDIHWLFTHFANKNRRTAVVKLMESLRHFLDHRGTDFWAVAVRESHEPYGEHCHILIHVLPKLREVFEEHARDFLSGGKRRQKRALECKPTYYSRGKLAYMLKGCTAPARQLLEPFNIAGDRRRDLDPSQGVINGKRLLISQALGPKARLSARHVISETIDSRVHGTTASSLPIAESVRPCVAMLSGGLRHAVCPQPSFRPSATLAMQIGAIEARTL